MPPILNKGKCIAYGVCVDICPTDVFGRREKRPPLSYGIRRSAGAATPVC